MARVAVIGSGVAGLAVAHGLADVAHVTLFEAGKHFGGHAHTVDVTLEGKTHGVDIGFLVLNDRTYPQLLALFKQLDVALAPSDMSFSVQVPQTGLEWCGSNLNSVFAQRSNLVRPSFWWLLIEVLRFNRLATREAIALESGTAGYSGTIGEFLDRHGFGSGFRDGYFLPMVACIWSCPTDQMLRFPLQTLLRFCHNHGLLQISNRPQWMTVVGGSQRYVEKIVHAIPDARLGCPVRAVRRPVQPGESVFVQTDAGTEAFDAVVLACHADQSLALLEAPSQAEREVLGAIRFQANRAVLHTDASLLPQRPLAWAAWNYVRAPDATREGSRVCLHYLINRLQPLPFSTPVIVSLNPITEPRADCVIGDFAVDHPVFDQAAIAAQERLPSIQGLNSMWFCGAWTRYGFHEDGVRSANAVLQGLRAQLLAEKPSHAQSSPPHQPGAEAL